MANSSITYAPRIEFWWEESLANCRLAISLILLQVVMNISHLNNRNDDVNEEQKKATNKTPINVQRNKYRNMKYRRRIRKQSMQTRNTLRTHMYSERALRRNIVKKCLAISSNPYASHTHTPTQTHTCYITTSYPLLSSDDNGLNAELMNPTPDGTQNLSSLSPLP